MKINLMKLPFVVKFKNYNKKNYKLFNNNKLKYINKKK